MYKFKERDPNKNVDYDRIVREIVREDENVQAFFIHVDESNDGYLFLKADFLAKFSPRHPAFVAGTMLGPEWGIDCIPLLVNFNPPRLNRKQLLLAPLGWRVNPRHVTIENAKQEIERARAEAVKYTITVETF